MTPDALSLEVELTQFGHTPNPDNLLAYCDTCGDELTEPIEFREGICLPCALGSMPIRPTPTLDTYVPDPEDAHLGSGPFCASCEMPVAANDPECFWCDGGEASNA